MRDNSFPDKDQIKGFNTTNNSQFQNTNNINFNNNSSKFNNAQNFGVFLPLLEENPIYIYKILEERDCICGPSYIYDQMYK